MQDNILLEEKNKASVLSKERKGLRRGEKDKNKSSF